MEAAVGCRYCDTPHVGLIVTQFRDRHGVYEFEKTKALAEHLQKVAALVSRCQSVRVCSQAPERPWVWLEEWETGSGNRQGQWCSDLEVVSLP